ncbi:alpha/beta hydrolase family protein [Formosa agariphila KMM 3901]|uniref:Alpha/beta hydrolase family protein n=1 Tax=Formosa agariphila (strain DSM 15362 / KCTC 12365 / LMG 23005 / KMM 3901 / M-2Alg 35-1) TaxID=1347342 RepID=T2KIV6_FORAG|nr:alpha/beta hydrolase [Formosa agariphila]CDF78341.1 alpha/beta hydrolase family protein [Formosa agariphila KMM 3901]
MKTLLIKTVGNYLNLLSYISKPYAANKALNLFVTPRKGRVLERHVDFLNTAFNEELTYNNHTIMTYRWLGKKGTILLAHGWESNSYRWKPLVTELNKKGYSVVALDAPAHGRSGSKEFNALLYAEYINVVAQRFKPHTIIAHSAGGMAATAFQNKYQYPALEKLILLGAPSEFKDIISRYVKMLGYNKRITHQLNKTIIKRFGVAPDSFSTAEILNNIKTKGLIIHDKSDTIIPYNDALLINKGFKNSTLITTEGLGHSLNDASVRDHIYNFLEA